MSNTEPFPEWAVTHVRAALNMGQSVPEVEQWLVVRGLVPEAAAAVVNSVLEKRIIEALR